MVTDHVVTDHVVTDEVAQEVPVLLDREGVGNCFGCAPGNPSGLHLRFLRRPDQSIEARVHLDHNLCGFEGVVHGGIQSAILDEVMGVAAQFALPSEADNLACVTAELSLQFLRPVMITGEVIAHAKVVHTKGRDIYVHGEIVAEDGSPLTTARSRWRQARRY